MVPILNGIGTDVACVGVCGTSCHAHTRTDGTRTTISISA